MSGGGDAAFLGRIVNRPTWLIVVWFCFFDAIATVAAWLFANDILLESRFFRLGRDRGFIEVIEYLKFFVIIYCFRHAYRDRPAAILRAWEILFWVMLVDNVVGLHEELGGWLAIRLEGMPSWVFPSIQDMSEVIVLALMEGIALLYVLYCIPKSLEPFKRLSVYLVMLVAAMALISIGSESLHSVLEEPSEIIGMTIITAFVHARFYSRYSRKTSIAYQPG